MSKDDLLRGLLAHSSDEGRYYGVVIGIVTSNRGGPQGMHCVRVQFPWLGSDDESHWARVASPMAGPGRGAYFLPEVGDEVLVAFEHGCVEHPYVIGALWNGRDASPENNDDGENNYRSLTSRSGHVIRLCDRAGQETIEIVDKTGNNRMVFSAADNKIVIEAQGDIELVSQTGKLSIRAVGIKLQSMAGIDVSANASVDIKGALVNLN
ncbi:phage baseplate assembly protein V [Massilia sp. IC2-278]|uniref:phage baseplate assembly protein V n=1 Tax=Massilia sp. IC2-278 TaxID=2887200 RepID=UPI001E58856C|nr:phage baseplate assembly protein V [Massilia sp. IC2-278]